MAIFNWAQTFYLDSKAVKNSPTATISAVGLFCRAKPSQSFNNSGVVSPGVRIIITETISGVPFMSRNTRYTTARAKYEDIVSSSDATAETKFVFKKPIILDTDKEYAMIVTYEQAAGFLFWTSRQGDYLVGTSNISPGPSGSSTGRFYTYIGTTDSVNIDDDDYYATGPEFNPNWRYLSDTDSKYKIYVARYYHNGVSVEANASIATTDTLYNISGFKANTITTSGNTLIVPLENMEIITYDQALSTKEAFVGGQMAYQNTVYWPGGIIGSTEAATVTTTQACTTITAAGSFPNGDSFNWNTVFNNYTGKKRVVFQDTSKVNVREVVSIPTNTTIIVDEPMTYTNSASKFMVTPTGVLSSFHKSTLEGRSSAFMFLKDSTANSTVRFVNNAIEGVSITASGTGYSNNDILVINGYEEVTGEVGGGYVAQANVRTDASGNVTAFYFSNNGAGFTNADAIYFVMANGTSGNITSNTANGSGLTLTYETGATIKTELRANNNFRGAIVQNMPVSEVFPYMELSIPDGASVNTALALNYKRLVSANTLSGYQYQVAQTTFNDIKIYHKNQTFDQDNIPAIMSKSNEFYSYYSNGSINDIVTPQRSKSMEMHFTRNSNNDYVSVCIESKPKLDMTRFEVNNDYTDEHTDRGNAWSKGVTNRVQFRRLSEDLVVYATAYRPPNTDVICYAKFHNSADPEAMDDKDWTKLDETFENSKLYSSKEDEDDYIELRYDVRQHPNTAAPIAGTITANGLGSANLDGVSTDFVTDLDVGDVVRVYPTLFPNNNLIAVVNTVANTTNIILGEAISNNGFIGVDLQVEKVSYPKQAFNNILNDNVIRYFNASQVSFDSYDTVQLKFVYQSTSNTKVPRIDDIEVYAASA